MKEKHNPLDPVAIVFVTYNDGKTEVFEHGSFASAARMLEYIYHDDNVLDATMEKV